MASKKKQHSIKAPKLDVVGKRWAIGGVLCRVAYINQGILFMAPVKWNEEDLPEGMYEGCVCYKVKNGKEIPV